SRRNAAGRPETTPTRAKRAARRRSRSRTPASGRAAAGSSTIGARVPSKSVTTAARSGRRANGSSRAATRSGDAIGRTVPSPTVRPRRGTRARSRLSALLTAIVAVAVGCGGGGVRIAFRPQPGARYEYVVTVHSTLRTELGDQPAQTDDQETVLRATHTVLRSQRAELVRVRVQLRTPGGTTRTFVVDLDRAAQLDAIETIEGLPAQVF